MLIQYKNHQFRGASMGIIENANEIIESYDRQGYTLTLRQLYYQFVSQNLIANTEKSYDRLGGIIRKAREAGLVSWESIEDRGRGIVTPYLDDDVEGKIKELPLHINFDPWLSQDYYVEVWVEKEALGNVVERACEPFKVPWMSCKGYLSASEAWRSGQRYLEADRRGKQCILIHVGDHDPSGIDMTRDNQERLELFSGSYRNEVKRIALNMNQIDKYNPPPNPAKVTDSRAADYIKRYGEISWELDALEPRILVNLIQKEIKKYIDVSEWKATEDMQLESRKILESLGSNWSDVKSFLKDNGYV